MAVNWSLGQMPDIGMNALAAFNQGREQRQQDDARAAFSNYAANPNDDGLNALAQYSPEFVIKERGRLQEQQAAQAEAAQKKRGETAKYVANAAFHIITLPPEQRAAAWDAFIDQGAAQHPDLTQYKGQYTPQALDALVAEAGKSQEFAQFQRPTYVPIGEQGLAGFQFGQPIQQGGRPQNFAAPQPGAIEDGYRFKGGNPADPNAWEQVAQGGPTQPASGGFRP